MTYGFIVYSPNIVYADIFSMYLVKLINFDFWKNLYAFMLEWREYASVSNSRTLFKLSVHYASDLCLQINGTMETKR
jgi:hypothetical protein